MANGWERQGKSRVTCLKIDNTTAYLKWEERKMEESTYISEDMLTVL